MFEIILRRLSAPTNNELSQ